MSIELRLPLRQIKVNQAFGANFFKDGVSFYSQLGLIGHNGVDFMAMNGFNCYAAHDGIITVSGVQSDGGIEIEIWNTDNNFKTIYYHLQDTLKSDGTSLQVGEKVAAGQLIGHCDNTGKYTTGSHLHFGIKQVYSDGSTTNYNNGYKGAIDPTPYFTMAYDGTPIKNSDCYKSNAYHRYFQSIRRLKDEIKGYVTLKTLSSEKVNSLVYGNWDKDYINNIAMADLCFFETKGDYINGKKPFQS